MTCSTCKHWQIIPTHESARTDRGMQDQGFRNCLKDPTEFRYAIFVHKNNKCGEYECVNKEKSIAL